MLAEEHRGHTEAVWDRRQQHPAGKLLRHHVVGPTDHQRAPDDEHSELAEADVFQREGATRVEHQQQRARQRKGQHAGSGRRDEKDADGGGGREDKCGNQEELSQAVAFAGKRVGAVVDTWRVRRVYAVAVVPEVVHEVASRVSEDEPNRHEN